MLETVKRGMFWIVANGCRKLYSAFPIFGALRASLAVIHQDGKFLVLHRNDGRGVSLPGGISNWREADDHTIDREVREETGMAVRGKKLILSFYSEVEFPCKISVFEVQVASGTAKKSWEGSPRWMTLAEIEPQLLESQRPVLPVFRKVMGGENTATLS
jgi:ADP-ribose pyrophosphatase YjhB (NUDIX family)